MKTFNKDNKTVAQFEKIQIEDGWVVVDKGAEIKEKWHGWAYKKDVGGSTTINKDRSRIQNSSMSGLFKHFYTTNTWYNDAKEVLCASKSLIDKYQMNVPEFISKEEQEERLTKLEIINLISAVKTNERFQNVNGLNLQATLKRMLDQHDKANQNKYSEESVKQAFISGLGYRNGAGQRNLSNEEIDRETNHFLQSLQTQTCYLEVEERCEKCGGNPNKSITKECKENTHRQLKVTDNKVYEL